MNNNTKKAFKALTRKQRSGMVRGSNPRNRWNTKGKVAANPPKRRFNNNDE
jgi:hypothetical protein